MRTKSLCCWKVSDGDGLLNNHEGTDIEDSIVQLNNCLNAYVNSGVVIIAISKKTGKEIAKGGDIKLDSFKIKYDTSINSAIPQNNNIGFQHDRLDAITQQIQSIKDKIDSIEEEEEEEEEEEIGQVETPANVFLESIKPHIPAITGLLLTKFGLIPQQQVEGINGIADSETDIDMIINELQSIDENIVIRLKKLVYLAKNDKNTYNLAVNFLNNLVSDNKV
jgi:hypothetical protein